MKFTAIDINAIGEHDIKYGTRYWGRVEDSDMPVSFNLMSPVDIPIGASLEFEERVIKETGPQSKNPGSEYLFLRKVKVGGGIPRQTAAPLGQPPLVHSDVQKLVELIYSDTQKILQLVDSATPKSLSEAWAETNGPNQRQKPPLDEVVEDIGDGEINLDQIPFE